MPQVIIVGNSGAARECYWLLQDMIQATPGLRNIYKFRGFLSWKHHVADLKSMSSWLLGDADDYVIHPDDVFVIGMGDPALRKAVFESFKKRGASFLTLIHPWSDINSTAQLGEGNIFQRGSTVYCDSVIGNANYFNGAVNVAHDVQIGDYNFFGPFSLLLGECHIGSGNMLSTQTTILPKARVGDGNLIAPGSFVYKGCKNNCRMAGNPALKVGQYRLEQSCAEMAKVEEQTSPPLAVLESSAQHLTAIFPMKGQSVRVPGKNVRPFCGKPLFSWALGELASCPSISRIIVDTDCDEIARCVTDFSKVSVHKRPEHLCGNHISMNAILDWIVSHDTHGNGHYLQSHATNPLLLGTTVEKAIAQYFSQLNTHDSLFSVTEMQIRLYDCHGSAMNHDPQFLLNTQDLPPVFAENSNLYIFSRTSFVQAGSRRIGQTPQVFPINKYESLDIDTEEDFRLAEAAFNLVRGPVISEKE